MKWDSCSMYGPGGTEVLFIIAMQDNANRQGQAIFVGSGIIEI